MSDRPHRKPFITINEAGQLRETRRTREQIILLLHHDSRVINILTASYIVINSPADLFICLILKRSRSRKQTKTQSKSGHENVSTLQNNS